MQGCARKDDEEEDYNVNKEEFKPDLTISFNFRCEKWMDARECLFVCV